MQIAYIGNFNTIYHEEGIARSLEKLGHTVNRYTESLFTDRTIEELVKEKPDFVLFPKLTVPLFTKKQLKKELEKENIPLVSWVPDLYWGLAREIKIQAKDGPFIADYALSPDGNNQDKFAEAGVKHDCLRQGIYHEEVGRGKKIDLDYEIVFVGTQNGQFPYRQKLMKFLEGEYGERFKWIGQFNEREVRDSDLNDLYASVKIVIGDSVYSPHYWSNRIYETIGRGGFIIHPDIPGLEKEFEYYKHFIPYKYGDFAGLKKKIDYFLEHDKEREKIVEAGIEHVRQNHTLIKRCEKLIELVQKNIGTNEQRKA